MEKLKTMDMVLIKQKIEWLEVFSGFESKNRYSILDSQGKEIYFAAERSSFWSRIFLKFSRSLEIHIMNLDGGNVFKIKKPFRFIFHEGNVENAEGVFIGNIKREFSFLEKKLRIRDKNAMEIYVLKASFFHPWIFKIYKNEIEVGEIIKKWSGVGKEFFTDADNFIVKFPAGITIEEKALLIAAALLIDIVYFEK